MSYPTRYGAGPSTLCLLLLGVTAVAAELPRGEYEVLTPTIGVKLSARGTIVGVTFGGGKIERAVRGATILAGCRVREESPVKKLDGGGFEFTRKLSSENAKRECTLVERFVPTRDSVRWEIEIRGSGEPWTTDNHCIGPSPWADEQYLAYGPLLDAMRGKRWVLLPHCIEAAGNAAKVNLFEVSGGYAMPVTFAGRAKSVEVVLRGLPGLSDKSRIEAIHPGAKNPVAVNFRRERDAVVLTVPLHRGCAMVRLTCGPVEPKRVSKNNSCVCHPERSEGSLSGPDQILRCAQDDGSQELQSHSWTPAKSKEEMR